MLNTSFQCRRCCWSGSVAKTLSIWDQSEIHDPIFSLLTYLLDNHTLWCRIIETLLCTRCSYDCHWFIKNRRNVVRCLQRKQQPRNCSSCKCCCIFVLPALCFGRFSRWMQQFSRFGEKPTHTCCIASCHRGALSRARPCLNWRWDVDCSSSVQVVQVVQVSKQIFSFYTNFCRVFLLLLL